MAKRPYIPHAAADGDPRAMPGGSRTLIEQAYAQLREDILDGRLPPDEKLRVEHLKDRYGVGAGTLREAITRLVSDALVVAEGQRGFRVAPMALADLADLTRLRVQIEIEALRRSVREGDAAWRARVQAAYDDISAIEQPLLPADARRWELANRRLHEALISGYDSPWTLKVLQQLSQHSERYRRAAIGLNDSRRDVHAEHALIVELALSGQEARAALALEAHIARTPDLLMQRWKASGGA